MSNLTGQYNNASACMEDALLEKKGVTVTPSGVLEVWFIFDTLV